MWHNRHSDLLAGLLLHNRHSSLHIHSTHRSTLVQSFFLFEQPIYPTYNPPPSYPPMSSHTIVIPVCIVDLPADLSSPNRFPCLTADLPHVQSSPDLPSNVLTHHRHSCLHSLSTRRINTLSIHRSINNPTRVIGIITFLFCYSRRDAVPTPHVHLYSSVHSFHLCLYRYTTSVTVLYPVLNTNCSVLSASWLYP